MGMGAQRIHIHLLRVNLHYAVRHSISWYWTALSDAASGDSLGPFSRETCFANPWRWTCVLQLTFLSLNIPEGNCCLFILFWVNLCLCSPMVIFLFCIFFCLLPHFPSIPAFVRNLFCVWEWLKCPSSNCNVSTKYCSSLVDTVAVIQSVELDAPLEAEISLPGLVKISPDSCTIFFSVL